MLLLKCLNPLGRCMTLGNARIYLPVEWTLSVGDKACGLLHRTFFRILKVKLSKKLFRKIQNCTLIFIKNWAFAKWKDIMNKLGIPNNNITSCMLTLKKNTLYYWLTWCACGVKQLVKMKDVKSKCIFSELKFSKHKRSTLYN